MKNLLLAGILALLSLTSCEYFCKCETEAEIICGEPLGSVGLRPVDDTVSICDLPRSYFVSVMNKYDWEMYDSLDWVFPEEAFDIEYRPDLQAVRFTVIEGTHTLMCRGHKLSEGEDWSDWGEWTWTLTLEE